MSMRGAIRAVVLALLTALLALPAVAQAAGPATLRLVANSPSLGRNVTVHAPTGDVQANPGRYQLTVTPQNATAAQRLGFCVDTAHVIHTGRDYAVVLEDADEVAGLATPAFGEIAWLLSRADGLIAAAPQAGAEAAALQVAIWQLSGQASGAAAPTSDAALNARAAELRALAAGRRVGAPLVIVPDRPAPCMGTEAVLLIGGDPGQVAQVEVVEGAATLSAGEVTLDARGEAALTVRSEVAGRVRVRARTEGVVLTRARKVDLANEPQDTVFLVPRTRTAEAELTFTDCGGGGVFELGAPPPPPAAPAPEPAPAEPPAPAPAAAPPAPAPPAPPARPASAPRLVVGTRPAGDGWLVVRVRNSGGRPALGVRVQAGARRVLVGTIPAGGVRVVRVRVGDAPRTEVVAGARNARTATKSAAARA
jgi:hypothetical protein